MNDYERRSRLKKANEKILSGNASMVDEMEKEELEKMGNVHWLKKYEHRKLQKETDENMSNIIGKDNARDAQKFINNLER